MVLFGIIRRNIGKIEPLIGLGLDFAQIHAVNRASGRIEGAVVSLFMDIGHQRLTARTEKADRLSVIIEIKGIRSFKGVLIVYGEIKLIEILKGF